MDHLKKGSNLNILRPKKVVSMFKKSSWNNIIIGSYIYLY